MPPISRRFIHLPSGSVHYAESGAGQPVLLLHQTPRSWDEFREVLPLLGRTNRAIAMDTIGFGDSSPLSTGENSIERWAEVALELLDALDIDRCALVGHHTGGCIAAEIAASRPERVVAVVLSAVAYRSEDERRRHETTRAPVDEVSPSLDGSHLAELWRLRSRFYPPNIDLLERFIVDCLKAGALAGEGHRIVARYPLEQRVPLVRCPVLIIAATDDPFTYPTVPALRAAIPQSLVTEINGGMIPLPNHLPQEFAAAVTEFLVQHVWG